MAVAKVLEQEINHYLERLNAHQKTLVPNVVKTLANEEDDWWAVVEKDAQPSI